MYAFAIENLRKAKRRDDDMWLFTVVWPSLGIREGIRTHGWKYIETSNQVRRPTAKDFPGALTNVDRAVLDEIRRQVQIEVAHHNKPVPARMVHKRLIDLKASHDTWSGVYEEILSTYEDLDTILTPGQWAILLAAAALAGVEYDETADAIEAISLKAVNERAVPEPADPDEDS